MILSVSYSKVEELYVQNPAFGFYFLRLASARLFQNIGTLEQRLAQQSARRPRRAEAGLTEPGKSAVASVLSSLRYLLADFIGERRRRAAVSAGRIAGRRGADRQRRHPSVDRLSGPELRAALRRSACSASSAGTTSMTRCSAKSRG